MYECWHSAALATRCDAKLLVLVRDYAGHPIIDKEAQPERPMLYQIPDEHEDSKLQLNSAAMVLFGEVG